MKKFPFKLFSDKKDSSNCVTALCPTNPNVNAHKLFEIIKDEYKIWICPNAGDMAEKVFRELVTLVQLQMKKLTNW